MKSSDGFAINCINTLLQKKKQHFLPWPESRTEYLPAAEIKLNLRRQYYTT
jgi:hypothetical protein